MKRLITILIAIIMVAAVAGIAHAALPGGPFSSAFYLQNLDVSPAKCSYQFFDTVGTVKYTSPNFIFQ